MSSIFLNKTVVVGMSGGVDSAVAALLLKQAGYKTIGLFMKNWEEKDSNGVCTSAQDYEDVVKICNKIGIDYYAIEFVKEYQERVFADFLENYKAGLTPNPDILCNREIKFDLFLKEAIKLGADYLATGHYCRNVVSDGKNELLKGCDGTKDQSYFLYTIKSEILSKVLFPIGELEKEEVRRIAKENGLSVHAKKGSTGICFIGERDFRKFLNQYLPYQPGEFKTLDGKTVGQHLGVAYYTLGQRRGLTLGGPGDRWYVVKKDPVQNVVYVERGSDHPALYSSALIADKVTWVRGDAPALPLKCMAKVRYRQKDQDCTISAAEDGRMRVEFLSKQRAVTPGQSVVFYQNDVCLGGGVINDLHETVIS